MDEEIAQNFTSLVLTKISKFASIKTPATKLDISILS